MEIIAAPINDAAKAVGVSRATIYRLIGAGQLNTFKIGRRTLVKADSLRALLEAA